MKKLNNLKNFVKYELNEISEKDNYTVPFLCLLVLACILSIGLIPKFLQIKSDFLKYCTFIIYFIHIGIYLSMSVDIIRRDYHNMLKLTATSKKEE